MPMVPEEGAWTTMTSIHYERVRHKRRLVSNMVSKDALRAFVPRETLYLDTFCNIIGGKAGASGWSSPKNMTFECQNLHFLLMMAISSLFAGRKLMVDIMSDFAFGQKIDIMTTPHLQFILDALGNYAWRMGFYKECPSLTKLQLERIQGYVGRFSSSKQWAQWGADYTSSILDSDCTGGCRFAAFQDSIDPITKAALTRAELSAEGFFLMLAGSVQWRNQESIHLLTNVQDLTRRQRRQVLHFSILHTTRLHTIKLPPRSGLPSQLLMRYTRAWHSQAVLISMHVSQRPCVYLRPLLALHGVMSNKKESLLMASLYRKIARSGRMSFLLATTSSQLVGPLLTSFFLLAAFMPSNASQIVLQILIASFRSVGSPALLLMQSNFPSLGLR